MKHVVPRRISLTAEKVYFLQSSHKEEDHLKPRGNQI